VKQELLIIDDDEPMRLLIDYLLKDNYKVTFKENGLAGMKWLADGNMPDAILCDFVLPKMNGFDFLSSLSNSGIFVDIPFIMMSSRIDEHFKKQCMQKGAKGFLEKPFDPPQLLGLLEGVLGKPVKD
jgi:two-component system chemotaxis response regulator CheY